MMNPDNVETLNEV